MCLTTTDAKFALPVGVKHLSKGLTAAETSAMLKKEVREVNMCLNHLKHNEMSTNNSVPANCCSHCRDCVNLNAVCDVCRRKGHTVIEPALRPCSDFMEKGIQCIKAAVI